jgi:hypothetical protein
MNGDFGDPFRNYVNRIDESTDTPVKGFDQKVEDCHYSTDTCRQSNEFGDVHFFNVVGEQVYGKHWLQAISDST